MKHALKPSLPAVLSAMFIFSLNSGVSAQIASYEWAERIGGSLVDESFSIAVDEEGNSYVTGIFTGSADIGDTTLTALGATDIFLVKYDPSGERIWVRQAGGKEDDDSYAVHVSHDGYCYLTGSFADTAYFETDTLICFDNNIFYYDIFLAKYTLDGNLIWVTRAGDAFWDEAFGIHTDASGDIFITGSYWGTARFDNITLSGLYGSGATDGFDIFIAKYDTDGNAQWAKRMVERGWDRGSDVVTDLFSNCYVTGGFQTALLFGGFGGPSLTATGGSGDEDIFLVKYTPGGDFIWKTSAGGEGFDQALALTIDSDSYLYVTGVFNDTAAFDSTHQISSQGFNDLFLAKYDTTGKLIWVRGAGGAGDDGGSDVTTDGDGNIFICGYFSGMAYFEELQVTGGGQFIAKYNPDGQIRWVKQIDETTNLAKSLALMPEGDLVVTGVFENTATFGGTVLTGQGQTDVYVTRLDTLMVTALPDLPVATSRSFLLAQNYPNPFNPYTIISWQQPFESHVELSVYNQLGERVAILLSQRMNLGTHYYRFDGKRLPSGVYYYQLVAGDPFPAESRGSGQRFREIKKMILLK